MTAAERIARAVELVREGASIAQAHRATRVTTDVIKKACKRAGVPVTTIKAKPMGATVRAPLVKDARLKFNTPASVLHQNRVMHHLRERRLMNDHGFEHSGLSWNERETLHELNLDRLEGCHDEQD